MNDQAAGDGQDDEPLIMAKIVNDESAIPANLVDEAHASDSTVADQPADQQVVRTGSPFAVDPEEWPEATLVVTPAKKEVLYDVGPLRYTAIGSVSAAIMVLGFAAAAAWWFPGGGSLIAALGCALSIFGLYSPNRYKLVAGGCLGLHLLLFLVSYGRAIIA